MFRRVIVLFTTVLALLLITAPAVLAQPPADGRVPQGFPPDLMKFIGGTAEFKQGPWFSTPECKDKGGDVSRYLNDVMHAESRLMYWSTPPGERAKFWPDQGTADVAKEPPELPKTFPAVLGQNHSFTVAARYCADELKEWTDPASNTWGFTWAAKPDAESLERMKPFAGGNDDVVAKFTDACADTKSPYCQKAFFADCGRVAMVPAKKERCQLWNESIANHFRGVSQFIASNTTWLEQIGAFFGIVGVGVVAAGRAPLDAFVAILSIPVTIAKFVTNPTGAFDEMANVLHQSAVDFMVKVLLDGLASVGTFDPSSPWFLATYSASTGVGLVVMAFMALLMISRVASGGGGRDDLQEALFKQLPLGVFLAVFAPAIAVVLTDVSRKLTHGIAAWEAHYVGNAVTKISELSAVTAVMMPGGVGVGSLVFLLLIIGTGAVFIGFAMQSVALPLAGFVAGIAWGMWVHPKWKRKAVRPAYTFLGLLLSKPLLYLLLGAVFALIDGNLSVPAMKAGGVTLLGQLVFVFVALIVIGLAPFSLLKYAPLLPTAADSHDSQPSSGFGTASVVGARFAAAERHRTTHTSEERSDSDSGGEDQHSITRTYRAGRNRPVKPQHPDGQRSNAGASASGRQDRSGQAGPAVAASGPQVSTAGAGGAATGTTVGASRSGAAAGTVLGPIGVAAQLGVAGFTKARQAAHTRHVPEADDDPVRGE